MGRLNFAVRADEVSYVSIERSSTSKGLFWRPSDAAGVMKVPLACQCVGRWLSYIRAENTCRTTKGSISEVLSGFRGK
jgi:hypothetical protein